MHQEINENIFVSDLMGCPLIELDGSWRLDRTKDPNPKRNNFPLGKFLVGILIGTGLLIIGTLIYCWYDRSRVGKYDLDEPLSMRKQPSGRSLPSWFHASLDPSNLPAKSSSSVDSKESGARVAPQKKQNTRPGRMVQRSKHGNSSLNPQESSTIETIDSNTGQVSNPRKPEQGKPAGSPKAKKVSFADSKGQKSPVRKAN